MRVGANNTPSGEDLGVPHGPRFLQTLTSLVDEAQCEAHGRVWKKSRTDLTPVDPFLPQRPYSCWGAAAEAHHTAEGSRPVLLLVFLSCDQRNGDAVGNAKTMPPREGLTPSIPLTTSSPASQPLFHALLGLIALTGS